MHEKPAKKRVLILCTGNSCRSQMAEGWVNSLLAARWEARSAGTRPAAAVHPLAVRAMAEAGIDASAAVPKTLDRYLDEPWDLVVTVCDAAREECPYFPGGREQIHVGFPDPATAEGSEEERLAIFRAVRDDIRVRLLPEIARRG
jgi:arsenate reductase